MKSLPLVRYELRRELPALGMALLALALLPLGRGVATGDWGYWDGDWNVWGAALALYVLAPLLVLALASSGWPRERALGTLEWLYARPLSKRMVFAVRAGVIVVAAVLWSAVALILQRVGTIELEHALSILPGLPGPAMLFAAEMALALGAGLFASVLASSPESAFRGSFLLMDAAFVGALLIVRTATTADVLIAATTANESPFLDHSIAAYLFAMAVALLAGAWRGSSGSPEDSRRLRRTLSVAGFGAAASLVGLAALLHLPLLAGREGRQAVWLGGERSLTLAPALGLESVRAITRDAAGPERVRFAHPILHQSGEKRVLRDVFTIGLGPWTFGEPMTSSTGAVVLWGTQDGQLLIEPTGEARALDLEVPPQGSTTPIGWSSDGHRFAWLWTPSSTAAADAHAARSGRHPRLVTLEADRSFRITPLPETVSFGWRSAWASHRAVLLAGAVSSRDEAAASAWVLVDVETSSARQGSLPPGLALDAPALDAWDSSHSALPRVGERPVVLLVDAARAAHDVPASDAAPSRLARIDLETGTIQPGRALQPEAYALSLGNLDDGTLVWAAAERRLGPPRWDGGSSTRVYRLEGFDTEPRLLCTFPHGHVARFRGRSGAWAVWESFWFPRYELWGCNLETGETRRIDEWKSWAHPVAAIGERGIFTPGGWVPLRNG